MRSRQRVPGARTISGRSAARRIEVTLILRLRPDGKFVAISLRERVDGVSASPSKAFGRADAIVYEIETGKKVAIQSLVATQGGRIPAHCLVIRLETTGISEFFVPEPGSG